jgi:hypothetical protein
MAANQQIEPAATADVAVAAFRVGLAARGGFATAVHQRIIVDIMYERSTEALGVREIIDATAANYPGLRLAVPQVRRALQHLVAERGVEEVRAGNRERLYRLTPEGRREWQEARREGLELEARVKAEYMDEVGVDDPADGDRRWSALLAELDGRFQRDAYRIARAFTDVRPREDFFGTADDEPGTDLARFLESARGDRMQFLRRVLHAALAYHLFRASPEADQAVLQHLRDRAFYLDTTVLYALVAEEGEMAALADDLVRLSSELGCRLRVTRETMREFQNSIAHHRRLLELHGVQNAELAAHILNERGSELSDFRRGYYRALQRTPDLTPEQYALRYELLEERLNEWGITTPETLPTRPVQGPDGRWIQIEGWEEYTDALDSHLAENPRIGGAEMSDGARHELARHDALHIAWVQQQRERVGVREPTRPSQVRVWFLTRDRTVCSWDARYVAEHGPGRIPRAIGLEEWVASVVVFVPALSNSEAVDALALRLLALRSPVMRTADEPSAADMEEIARIANGFGLNPDETARLTTDRVLNDQLEHTAGARARERVIESAAVAMRNDQLARAHEEKLALQGERTVLRTGKQEAESRAATLEKRLLGVEARLAEVEAAPPPPPDPKLVADAAFGRRIQEKAPRALILALFLTALAVAVAAFIPELWSDAGWFRRLVYGIGVGSAVVAATLWGLGEYTRAKWVGVIVTATAGAFLTIAQVWQLGPQSESAKVPSKEAPSATKSIEPAEPLGRSREQGGNAP